MVSLCLDDNGMPASVADRLPIAERLASGLAAAGVQEDAIYLDPLIKPLAVGSGHGPEALESLRAVRERYRACT